MTHCVKINILYVYIIWDKKENMKPCVVSVCHFSVFSSCVLKCMMPAKLIIHFFLNKKVVNFAVFNFLLRMRRELYCNFGDKHNLSLRNKLILNSIISQLASSNYYMLKFISAEIISIHLSLYQSFPPLQNNTSPFVL